MQKHPKSRETPTFSAPAALSEVSGDVFSSALRFSASKVTLSAMAASSQSSSQRSCACSRSFYDLRKPHHDCKDMAYMMNAYIYNITII